MGDVTANDEPRSPERTCRAMNGAQRRKRVFSIDVTTCVHCGGAVRIVASVEEPTAIRAILDHFEKHRALAQAHYRPAARALPDRLPQRQPFDRSLGAAAFTGVDARMASSRRSQ